MAEAEYLLPLRQRSSESALSASANGEEPTPSPLPDDKPKSPSVCAGPPSPGLTLNRNGHHLLKNSTAPAGKSKAVRKKKKCLSDIFSHIVGGSKDSALSHTDGQFHTKTRALKDEPKDSPYSDMDSVPMLHRPKRTAISPIHSRETSNRKDQGSVLVKKSKKLSQSSSSASPKVLTNKLSPKNVNSDQSWAVHVSSSQASEDKRSEDLPASSGLRTMEEPDLGDAPASSHISSPDPIDGPLYLTPTKAAVKTELSPVWESLSSTLSFVNSPKRRPRKLSKKQTLNGLIVKPKQESLAKPAWIKTENVASDLSTTSPSLSPMDTFQDCKELSSKSLVNEDGDSEAVFRPDSNYKFSTFLMLLKDMHDTREREGKPLLLPPSADLIKEEPLVIPTSTQSHLLKASCEASENRLTGPSGKDAVTQSTPVKVWSKAVQAADTNHFEDFPLHFETPDKQRRKQKLPAKLKVRNPATASGPIDTAYGGEFGGGCSGSDSNLNLSNSYLERTPEKAVAPKKRWQVLEEVSAEIKEEVVSETKESYNVTACPDPDLGANKLTENDSQSSDASSTAGESQTKPVSFSAMTLQKNKYEINVCATCFHRTIREQTPPETN